MRVFLSVLIFLVLVACNSAPDEVAVEETTADVIADSVPFIEEEVDTIETKVEEDEDLEVNAANDRLSKEAEYSRMEDEKMKLISKLKKGEAIRIHCDTLDKLGFSEVPDDGMIDNNDNLFSGICFETYENGTIKYETDYKLGRRMGFRSYYENGQIYYSSKVTAFFDGDPGEWIEDESGESFWLSNYGYDAYEINEVLFYYKNGVRKGKYENNYHSHNDIYTGISWHKNGKLSRQVKLINEEEEDHNLMETVEKCFDEKGYEIDCEKVKFTECYNCDQPPLDKK